MGISQLLWKAPGIGEGGDPHALLMSFAPTFYVRNNEAAGACINWGSDGVNGSGTVTGCTQGQTGQLGPGEAYSFDGVDDVVTFANAAVPATKALTTQRWVFLVKATSLGEASAGRFFFWGNAYFLTFNTTNRLQMTVDFDGTDAAATSNNNQVDFLNTWTLVFADVDFTNALGLGIRIRLLRATAASPATLLTLATNTAGVGSVVVPSTAIYIGNNSTTVVTFAGLMDFGMGGAGLWSPAGAPGVLTDCQRLRHEVFNV